MKMINISLRYSDRYELVKVKAYRIFTAKGFTFAITRWWGFGQESKRFYDCSEVSSGSTIGKVSESRTIDQAMQLAEIRLESIPQSEIKAAVDYYIEKHGRAN